MSYAASLRPHADAMVAALIRAAGVVDAHGNLHSPKDGKFIPKGAGVLGGSFETFASLIGAVERSEENEFGLPQSVIYRYMNGDCMNFAAAINRLTNGKFKMRLLTSDDGESGHVVTLAPDGRIFDVAGYKPVDALELGEPGRYADMIPTSESKLEELGWFVSPDLDDVRLATVLLHEAGIELDPEYVGWVHEQAAAGRDDYIDIGEQAKADYEKAVGA